MNKVMRPWIWLAVLLMGLFVAASSPIRAQDAEDSDSSDAKVKKSDDKSDKDEKDKDDDDEDEPDFPEYAKTVKGMEEIPGLFKLYRKEQKLYAEILPPQFDKDYLAPIAIAKGAAMAGNPLNFNDEWVLRFKRVDKKVHLIRKNVHFKAEDGSPRAKAVGQNYTDSVLMSLEIVTINPNNQGVLINLGDLFMTDFAQLGLGSFDSERSTWHKVKAFEKNLEIQVEATYSAGGYFSSGGGSVIDPRGMTLVIHYSLIELPESDYKPRMADYRVGHFLNTVRYYDEADPEKEYNRMINRWRLEKSHPDAKLSAPKKQIV